MSTAAVGQQPHDDISLTAMVTLPDSIGAQVTLDVAEVLKAGRPKGS